MKSNRDTCIKETLKWEGGYTNHPSDPGGATNWGITIADAKRYWKKDATASDVKNMPLQVAVDIYATKYWKTPHYDCDQLASGVDLAVFDFGVNSGPARAKKYLLLSIGGSDIQTINNLMDKREDFLKGLKTFPVFGKGWMNRTKGIRAKSLTLAKTPVKIEDALVPVVIATGAVAATFWDYALYLSIGAAGLLALYLLIKYIKRNRNV